MGLMTRFARLCVTAALLAASTASLGAETSIAGQWAGAAFFRGGSVSVRLDIVATDEGISAVLDIPESKLVRFTVPEARYDGRRLTFDVPGEWDLAMFRDIGIPPAEQVIHYEGVHKRDRMVGTLRLASASFDLDLERRSSSSQPPHDVPYDREEVTFRNGEVMLAGTLYLPRGETPFPRRRVRPRIRKRDPRCVCRRSRCAGARWDRRAHLRQARRGRIDRRELAGRDLRRARERCDDGCRDAREASPDRRTADRALWPQSGDVADRHGRGAERDVGFLIFASGSGVAVWEQEIYRATTFMRLAGFSESDIAECERYERLKFDVSRTGLGWDELAVLGKSLESARWFDDYAGAYATLGSARFWWLAAYHYDPTATLENTRVPVLGLFGENDLSFPIPIVVSRMESALAKAGNTDVTLHVISGAEHQLMVPQMRDGRPFRRVLSPEVLPMMIRWIQDPGHRSPDASI
jgi:pimeloyl-ACP methyl ester carboxylesterase